MLSLNRCVFVLASVSLFLLWDSTPLHAQDATATASADLSLPATDEGLPGAGPIRRADWFQGLWRTRRDAFASRAEQERGAVVFLGDSITQGWADDFRGVFADMKVANRGISGDTTRGMLIRLQEDVLSLDPACVVLLMGTNDIGMDAAPKTVADNVALIISELKQHNAEMPIVLCLVFPSSKSKDRPADTIKELNRLLAATVKGDPQVTLLDTWTLFSSAGGEAKIEEFPDLLHPNQVGYAKWKKAIWPIFATLGFVETQPEEFTLEPGFESLFNGKDLSGWGFRPTPEQMLKGRQRWLSRDPENAPAWPIVTAPVSFDGKSVTDGGRYLAKNGRLVVTTPPEGRKIQQLWTTREFTGNFKLVLEFRATPNADSGVFIRKPQLQCRDFPLAGPYKDLKSFRAGQWNELAVEVNNGIAHCTCNGEVIEDALKVTDSGPIGLEGDRGQVEYRRIRIKQLP
jgi:lysophospholipase L1-like esterase